MSRFHIVLSTIIVLAMLCLVMMAKAFAQQAACGDRDAIVKMLSEKYQEQVVDRGLIPSQQQILEIFASPSGSWTVLVSRPSGMTCIMGCGRGLQTH